MSKVLVSDSRGQRRFLARFMLYLGALSIALWITLPLLNAVVASFNTSSQGSILAHYAKVFDRTSTNGFGKLLIPALGNSTFVSLAVVAINIILGAMTGYGLSRHVTKTTKAFYGATLVFRVVPALAVVTPFFALFKQVGLINTPTALIITYLSFTIPLALMVLKNYYDQLPVEIEHAAAIDGASRWATFTRVTLPLAAPGLGATAILVFMEAWSEFFYALVLTNKLTITPSLSSFQSAQNFDWHVLAAATLISMIPPLVLATLFQRSIVGSLAVGYDR